LRNIKLGAGWLLLLIRRSRDCPLVMVLTRRALTILLAVSSLPFLAGQVGRLRGDGLPASRALLDVRVIALRIGTVIPIS
jgi:hypothetical protein